MKHIAFKGEDLQPLYASAMGSGLPIVILHGGGPDRQSVIPFAKLLQRNYQVIFPDIRGYGQSVCFDKSKHTWGQYARDVISLADHLGVKKIVICGMGMGSSIAERVAFTYPKRVSGVVLISPETLDKDGEGSSQTEREMMDKCAEVAKTDGLKKAWRPFMKDLAPVINTMVKEAIPRTDPNSFSAAMAIVHSKRLENHKQLFGIKAPTLVIPGGDARHSSNIGKTYQRLIPNCLLGESFDWYAIQTPQDLAEITVPQIEGFIKNNMNEFK